MQNYFIFTDVKTFINRVHNGLLLFSTASSVFSNYKVGIYPFSNK